MAAAWYARFFAGTRGRLIALLRRQTRTVEELAEELDVTDNAVRAHLAALERDGLVRQMGVRRGGGIGKPAYDYTLTSEAEHLFPKAHDRILREVLSTLATRMAPEEVDALAREVGRRLAAERPQPSGDLAARLAAGVALLGDLGGLAEVEVRDGTCAIQGYSCPLATIVPDHPEVCHLAETLLSDVVGVPVRTCCQREGVPRCRFEVAGARCA